MVLDRSNSHKNIKKMNRMLVIQILRQRMPAALQQEVIDRTDHLQLIKVKLTLTA
jgi:hypothetical protein